MKRVIAMVVCMILYMAALIYVGIFTTVKYPPSNDYGTQIPAAAVAVYPGIIIPALQKSFRRKK